MTHRLVLDAPPATSAGKGAVRVRVTALDRNERPVVGAELVLEASLGDGDNTTTVELTPGEPGEYGGVLRTRRAGCWSLRAQDRATKVVGTACAPVTPGPPTALRLVDEPDPRRAAPYGEVWLRVRLEDRYANAIDPEKIRCAVTGATIALTVRTDQEARFLLERRSGNGTAVARLSAGELRQRQAVRFAPAWIGDPGFVAVGSTFRTPVYVMPPAGRPLTKTKVTVAFNSRRARFSAWTPSEQVAGLKQTVDVRRNEVVIEVAPRRPVPAALNPDGLELGEIEWTCSGEGATCFFVTAEMSPVSEPWKLCPSQKRERQKCVCINIINRSGDLKAMEAGDRALRDVWKILSTKNIARCCPSLRIELHHCHISAGDWRNKVIPAVGAGGQVRTHAQVDALYALDLCQRKKCINFLMIEMDHSYADGDAGTIGPRHGSDRSFGVINPDYVDSVHNIGAHEIGHALGLEHVTNSQGDNVMSETQPHGDNLTEDQCKSLWRFLDSYACS
jgi:hypothetical protein